VNLAGLLALQDLDTRLQQLGNRRSRLPDRATLASAKASLATHDSAAAACAARVAAAEAEIERIEHEAAALTTKRTRLEAQLKTVIAPREAEALMNQIATINQQRDELDDHELVAMEAQTEAESEAASLATVRPSLLAARDEAAAALAAAEQEIDGEAAELNGERPSLVAALSADEVAWYDRMFAHHEGQGIVRLQGHRCSGCHLDLTAGELDAVKATPADEFAECPQCSRALAR
jgi:predicted  nucleic acid-binding Zn-ribbon protein